MEALAPDPLTKDGDMASNWQNWKEDFIIFLKVTRYNNKSNQIRVNLLKKLIGKVGIEAIQNISFDNIQDKNNIDILIEKLEEYFNPSKKEVVERYQFFTTRIKKQNESIEQYISILKEKAETCNFNDMTDSLIRDKIVLNTHDEILRNKFFDADHLDLPKLGAIYNDYNINTEKIEQDTKVNETKDVRKHCWRCHVRHPQGKCPAWGSKCRKCGQMNHFTHCCRRPRRPKMNNDKNNKWNNQACSTDKTMNSMNKMTSFPDIPTTLQDVAIDNDSTFDFVIVNTDNTNSKLYDDNTTNHSAHLPKSTHYSHSHTEEVKPDGIITDLYNIGENIQPKQTTNFSNISTTPCDSANSTVGNESTFDSVKINTHNTRSKLYDDNTTNHSAHLPKSTHYSRSFTEGVELDTWNSIYPIESDVFDLYKRYENIQPKQTISFSDISTTPCDSANSIIGNDSTFNSVIANTHNTNSKLYDDNTTSHSAHLPKITHYSRSFTEGVELDTWNSIYPIESDVFDLYKRYENIQPKQTTSFSDISTTPCDSANSTIGNDSTFDSVIVNTHNTNSKLYDDNTTNHSAHLPKSTHYSHSHTEEVKPDGIITDLYNIGENIQPKQTTNFSNISTTPCDSANSTVANDSTFDSVKINTHNTRSKLYDDNTTNHSAHLPKITHYSHSHTEEVKPDGIIADLYNIGENIQPKQTTNFSNISTTPCDSANSTVGNDSTFDSVKINTHNTRSKLYDDNTTNHSAHLPKITHYSHSHTEEVKSDGIITDLYNIGENIQPKQTTSFSDISTTPCDSANSTVGNDSTFDSAIINTHNTRSKLYHISKLYQSYIDNTTNHSAHLPKSTHYSHSHTEEVKPDGIITDLYNVGENIQSKQTTNLSNISTTPCDSANSTIGNDSTFDSVIVNTHNTRSKLYDDNTTNHSAHLPKSPHYSHSHTEEVKPDGIITDLYNVGENIQPKQTTSFSDISTTPCDSANSTVGNDSTFDSAIINTHNTRSKLYHISKLYQSYIDNTTNHSAHLPKSTHYSHSHTEEVKPDGIITDLYNIDENIQPKQTTSFSDISTTSCDSANSTVGNDSTFDSAIINTHNTRSKLYHISKLYQSYIDNTTNHSAHLPKSTHYSHSHTEEVKPDGIITDLYNIGENIQPKQTTNFSNISTTPCDSANSTIGNGSTFNSVIANTHNTSSKLYHDNNTTNYSTHLPKSTQNSCSFTEEVELDTSDSIYLIKSDFIDLCKRDENIQPKQTKTARAGISQMPNRFLKWLRSKIHCKQCRR